ncbi:MAG: long-chain fatty acid--CoA ligase [Ramlibacter sp.]|nr:long-chain fatty acid--CoA ligase [Ramlibacter sp.]
MANLFDYLSFRARLDPASVAIQTPERSISAGQLYTFAKAVAAKLRLAGIRPGQFVATSIRAKEFDWLVTLALFHEAAVTCSASDNTQLAPPLQWDWMITDRVPEGGAGANTIVLDDAWIESARQSYQPIEQRDYASTDSITRIYLTSGTTGRPKAVAVTIAQLVGRAKVGITIRGSWTALSTLGMTTAGDFNAVMYSLVTGAPLYITRSPADTIDLVRRFSIGGLFSSPAQLSAVIRILMDNKQTLSLKVVRTAGAAPSRTLIKNIQAHLSPNIVAHYGSTEAGGMCVNKLTSESNPAEVGYPLLEAQVEVVDESHRRVPVGEVGSVRIKTAFMVQEYFRSPEESARSFRDGWFYPGDRGSLNKKGALVLAGRDNEVVNIGGGKIDPTLIDQFVADYPGVEDAAVFAAETATGSKNTAIAIVAADGLDMDALGRTLRERFGKASPTVYWRITQIPRNAMGKVMRGTIGEQYARHRAKAAAG